MSNLRREALVLVAAAALSFLVLALVLGVMIGSAISGEAGQEYWATRVVPIALYSMAIFAAGWAGWQMATKREFTRVIPRLLSLIGAFLALAGLFETFGTPMFMRLLARSQWQGIGVFDPSYVAIGTIGLLLWLLGRVMHRAVEMAQELEEIP